MRRVATTLAACVLSAAAVGCFNRVEGTGRTQLLLTSAEQENQLGAQAYGEILGQEKKSTDAEAAAMIQRVGKRLAAVAPDHGFEWEFTLIESDQMNAFCLPGGKVAFYTGILGLCRNEAGIATVMGHEIAHAIARHGGERMSQAMAAQGLGTAFQAWLEGRDSSPALTQGAMLAFGAVAQVGVMLPFSRTHELEADEMGLEYMAKAGYDPKEGVEFWERFAQVAGSDGGIAKYFSTHPASGDRAAAFREQMAAAQKHYAAAPQKLGAGAPVPAKYRK